MALKWVLANDANDKINKGQIIINQNTTFTGDATFLSKGTDESITINSGSIVFKRNDIPLTTIKNIRFGSITTDYNGKGRVSFQGFKKPILILPSVRSFTSDSNIASLWCYAEEVDANTNTYKFIIKATSEYHTPPTDIKVMGKVAKFENSIGYTWKNLGFKMVGQGTGNIGFTNRGGDYNRKDTITFTKRPYYKVICYEITASSKNLVFEEIIYTQPTYYFNKPSYREEPFYDWEWDRLIRDGSYSVSIPPFDYAKILNRYTQTSRTNVTLEFEIQVLDGTLEWGQVTMGCPTYYDRGDGNSDSKITCINTHGQTRADFITLSHFTGHYITYSSETSEISNPWGEGEVQYIAMEIDDK